LLDILHISTAVFGGAPKVDKTTDAFIRLAVTRLKPCVNEICEAFRLAPDSAGALIVFIGWNRIFNFK